MFFLKIDTNTERDAYLVLTLQQIVLSKNRQIAVEEAKAVLTLQQIVLSKNEIEHNNGGVLVLTLQQIVLSKNSIDVGLFYTFI